ncbi:MAG TPA: hypothetical protein VGV10_05690 [Thermoleophilaceae bacterium]|nr:hypothetical protein [Thermoleophilaceae bacterium]
MELRRSLNGALAGGVAAAVWAAQQPLDKRAFGSSMDDIELLGKAVAHGRAWPLPGVALHVQNGAAFGVLYAQLRRFVPGPAPVVGLGAAMVEHLATWPLVGVVDRLHPRRGELPRLKGDRRAFWQATWRHAVFGLVVGALERRLNPDMDEERPVVPVSSNGHGSMEAAVGVA